MPRSTPSLGQVRSTGGRDSRKRARKGAVRLSELPATSSGVPAATTRAALVAGAGADVDHPVARRDHAHVVLDHDHGVAGVDQAVELRHQLLDVGRVQAGGGLVEHVQRVAALRALQLGRQLDALRLAARQLGRRLAEPQVAEADLAQHVERAPHVRLVGEELAGRVDRHARARRRCSCRDSVISSVLAL